MLNEYSANITKLYQPINELHKKNIRVLWTLQVPVVEEKLKYKNKMITNYLIDQYNDAVIEVSQYSPEQIHLRISTKQKNYPFFGISLMYYFYHKISQYHLYQKKIYEKKVP